MIGQGFEWAMVGNIFDEAAVARALARPRRWRLLGDLFGEVLEEWVAGRPLSTAQGDEGSDQKGEFDMELYGECFVRCRLERELHGQGWCCLVRDLDSDDEPEFEDAMRVVVREIPPTLLVTCSVSPATSSQPHDVTFTALAGNLIAQSSIETFGPAKFAELCQLAVLAAVQQGRLRSQNQKVCVMLEGQAEPLGVLTVPHHVWHLFGL